MSAAIQQVASQEKSAIQKRSPNDLKSMESNSFESSFSQSLLGHNGKLPASAIRTSAGIIQPKLKVGPADDAYEREADSVADQVVQRMASAEKPAIQSQVPPGIQRKCAACEGEDEQIQMKPLNISNMVQAKADNGGLQASKGISSQIKASQGGGGRMSGNTLSQMNQSFGRDFSQVRIHTDSNAAQLNKQLNAKAFTVGNDIYFGQGQYQPSSKMGQHLLAHELVHTVQQGGNAMGIQREGEGEATVSGVSASLSGSVTFSGSMGTLNMALDTDIAAGTYEINYSTADSELKIMGAPTTQRFNVSIATPTHAQVRMYHAYIEYLSSHNAPLTITEQTAEPEPRPETPSPAPRDPNAVYLSPEEMQARCNSGDMPGVMVFPFRGTRFGAAPIMAERDGEFIRVKQPLYVRGDSNFRDQVRTLPLDTFINGVRIRPNQVVRVRVFNPHWYQLNITGDSSWDEQSEFCVTGEQMLEIAAASDRATLTNIGLTVVDAATLFIPVGRILGRVAQPFLSAGRTGLAAAMIGTAEAAPTALGGISSRAATMVVEEQVMTHVAEIPIRQTIARTVVEVGADGALRESASPLMTSGLRSTVGGMAAEATARTGIAGMAETAGQAGSSRLGPQIMVLGPNGRLIVAEGATEAELAIVGRPTSLAGLEANGIRGVSARAGTPARPVVMQGPFPTCGPVSCSMAAQSGTIELRAEILEGMLRDFPNGAWGADMVQMLRGLRVASRSVSGQTVDSLATATATGQPAIALIQTTARGHGLHWVVVDGVTTRNGVRVLAIRNPWGIQYFQETEAFRSIFTGQAVIIDHWF